MSWFTREVLKNSAIIRKIQLEQIDANHKKDQEYVDEIKRAATSKNTNKDGAE